MTNIPEHASGGRASPLAPDRASGPGLASSAGADLPAMQARFVADFAAGLVGPRHNTYQHRSRVLRQLTEAARIRDASATP